MAESFENANILQFYEIYSYSMIGTKERTVARGDFGGKGRAPVTGLPQPPELKGKKGENGER